MPKAHPKPTWMIWVVVTLIGSSLRFADERFNGGRVDHFMYEHFWLVLFLPMTLLALFLFVRGFYLEYSR